MDVPLYVTKCFSLATFKILSLALNFEILMIMSLDVDLFGLPYLEIWELPQSRCLFPSHVRKVFYPFPSLFSFWGPHNINVCPLDVMSYVP